MLTLLQNTNKIFVLSPAQDATQLTNSCEGQHTNTMIIHLHQNETESNTNSQPVNSNILSAFEHPVFNVKKEMFISGKGRKKNSNNEGVTKKGPREHFLKIVKKKK